MKKLRNFLQNDLWILFLDIIAVNISYYMALLIRFFVAFRFSPFADKYMPYFYRFAPWYTVLAIFVFACFRLYGGMWRYAGLNDMNRIICANLVTAVIHVVGTLLFVARMPISYYIIGAFLQFLAIIVIRFSYRFVEVEKSRLERRKGEQVPALVVGSGEYGQKIVHYLYENTPFRVVLIAGDDSGRFMDGVPIIPMENIQKQIDSKKIQAIFIADENLTKEQRKALDSTGVEVRDYTGYLNNLSGVLPLSSLLDVTEGPVTIVIKGRERVYASAREARNSLVDRYDVKSVQSPRIEIKKSYTDESWIREYEEETGEDVSFF